MGSRRTCANCRYSVARDYGYSNVSVEGTEVDCLLHLNPGFPDDRWYGKANALQHAAACSQYRWVKNSIHIDVEQELGDPEKYTDDPERKDLLRRWR